MAEIKTLAQLKRDITPGLTIEWLKLEELSYGNKSAGLQLLNISEGREKRQVNIVDTTGFYLKNDYFTASKKGSFCNWPKASELEYIDNIFTITETDHNGEIWQRRTYKII